MNQLTISLHSTLGYRRTGVVHSTLTRVGAQIAAWAARRRARAALLELDEAALKDMGISRAQALYELDHPRSRH